MRDVHKLFRAQLPWHKDLAGNAGAMLRARVLSLMRMHHEISPARVRTSHLHWGLPSPGISPADMDTHRPPPILSLL